MSLQAEIHGDFALTCSSFTFLSFCIKIIDEPSFDSRIKLHCFTVLCRVGTPRWSVLCNISGLEVFRSCGSNFVFGSGEGLTQNNLCGLTCGLLEANKSLAGSSVVTIVKCQCTLSHFVCVK